MGQNIYSGTIKPQGYQLLSSLTGINFEQDVKYQIQLLNPAYMREGLVGRGFLVNTNKPFIYIADAPLYITAPESLYDSVTLNISQEGAEATPPEPTPQAIVDLTDISELYRDSEYKLYKDVSLETPFTATLDDTDVQVLTDPANTTTIGVTKYVKLTASTQDVYNADNEGLVVNPDNILCTLEDGVPTTTNVTITDVEGGAE